MPPNNKNNRKQCRESKRPRSPMESMACSVSLVDVTSEAGHKTIILEQKLEQLESQLLLMEATLSKLAPLTYIIDPSNHPNLESLLSASNLLDSISSEVHRRIKSSKNAVVFNVPDRWSLPTVKQLLLSACNMTHHECYVIRLRKKTQRNMCPLLFQFRDENSALEFIRNRGTIAAATALNTIKIVADKTPLQREVLNISKSKVTVCQSPNTALAISSQPQPAENAPQSTNILMRNVDLDASISPLLLQPPSKRLHVTSQSPLPTTPILVRQSSLMPNSPDPNPPLDQIDTITAARPSECPEYAATARSTETQTAVLSVTRIPTQSQETEDFNATSALVNRKTKPTTMCQTTRRRLNTNIPSTSSYPPQSLAYSVGRPANKLINIPPYLPTSTLSHPFNFPLNYFSPYGQQMNTSPGLNQLSNAFRIQPPFYNPFRYNTGPRGTASSQIIPLPPFFRPYPPPSHLPFPLFPQPHNYEPPLHTFDGRSTFLPSQHLSS